MNSIATGLTNAVANQKKAEIDLLTNEVESAQYEVSELQAVVSSLTDKSNQYQSFLSQAEANKASALNNLNAVTDAVNSAKVFLDDTRTALTQTVAASGKMSLTASGLSTLINKLILSVEVIDKLSQIVNKQKALNPLIPDELITLLGKATTDANNAIALTLTSLSSSYAAEASLLESQKITALENNQATVLYKKMTQGMKAHRQPINPQDVNMSLESEGTGIQALLNFAYQNAVKDYENALIASDEVNKQLDHAQAQLDKATTKLNSLTAGLAAAQAAAFAA